MKTYRIVRYYRDSVPGAPEREVIQSGLTREEAKAHCSLPETSGTDENGRKFFDGFEEEEDE